MRPPSEQTLEMLLKSFKLPTFAREYAAVGDTAAREGLTHPAYLLALARMEAHERADRRTLRLLEESRLPKEKSLASFDLGTMQLIIYFGVVVPLVISAVVYVVRLILAEGRRIRSRLADYVLLGWLPEVDLQVQPKLRLRLWAGMVGLTRGIPVLLATLRLQRTLTELAYLRDGEVRGIYDQAAVARERQLVESAQGLRSTAIVDPRGMKLELPRWRRGKPVSYGLPNYPGPAGIGGNWPAPGGTPGGVSHSTVDPNWGPPRG